MNWIRKNKTNILLSVASIIITIIALDIVLYFSHYRYHISRNLYPQFYFKKDIEIGHDIALNVATTTHVFEDFEYPVWSNNLGCFDTNYNGETPYIYMAGDSLTWGFAPFADKWGTKIQSYLGVRTLKCGVTGGYGTNQEYIKAERLLAKLPEPPKIIIVEYFGGNDIDEDANFPINTIYNGYLVPNIAKGSTTEAVAQEKYARFDATCSREVSSHPIIQQVRCFLSNHSVLYNLVKKDIRDWVTSILPKEIFEKVDLIAHEKVAVAKSTDSSFEQHLQNILKFKELAREKNAKLLFVLYPYDDNAKIQTFLEKEKIEYLDLTPMITVYEKITPLHWKMNGHTNIAGDHLIGAVVSKYIIENNLVVVSDKENKLENIHSQIEKEFGVGL
jgi:lysophospholipase L1-like esterase